MRTIFDGEDLDQIRGLARRFAQERVAPGYLERERQGRFDHALMRGMGALGLIAPELPEEFGGMGAGYLCSGAIIEEIAKADFTFAYVSLLASLNGQIPRQFTRPEVARDGLRGLTAGDLLLAIALTEPKGGSDAASLGLRMTRPGPMSPSAGPSASPCRPSRGSPINWPISIRRSRPRD